MADEPRLTQALRHASEELHAIGAAETHPRAADLRLIQDRGFARNKALEPEFETMLHEFGDAEPPGHRGPSSA